MHLKTHIRNFCIVAITCLMALSLTAYSDFDKGMAAYDSGDFKTAFLEFKKAAEQNNAEAQFKIGWMYIRGEGVIQNYQEAAKWFLLGARQGNAPAQHLLGIAYERGYGVPVDVEEAVKWYQLAAEQGHSVAQFYLSAIYFTDKGGIRNEKEATRLLRLAAENGYSEAQVLPCRGIPAGHRILKR
jgi:TPR repeat protein